MDEVREFCRRVLGTGPAAEEAAAQAREKGSEDRAQLLAAAAYACRERADAQDREPADSPAPYAAQGSLAEAVAGELAAATAALPERQREVLALRELLRLSYQDIAEVMAIEPTAVAPLLARARLRLRAQRRGPYEVTSADCEASERALRVLTQRQDGVAVPEGEREWMAGHLPSCKACQVAHAAMLEASVCYRAWPDGQPAESIGAESDR